MISILEYDRSRPDAVLPREDNATNEVSERVADIIAAVRRDGDAALRAYAEKFDRVTLDSLEVTPDEMRAALDAVPAKFLEVAKKSAANIEAFHRRQVREGFRFEPAGGVVLGQKVTPLDRVGLYIPGGTAPLSSSVLMNAIPAKIAGVPNIVMATPPAKDGGVSPYILAAAHVAGVTRIFKMGGAQAIAALAYGTETVPAVDKIVGPGNAYVAEAKRQVFGRVAIDMIAGPSEILIVADGGCDPAFVAADLLSQAEHDRLASAVLVTPDRALAQAVQQELEAQIPRLPRAEIARTSIDNRGKIIIVENIDEAIEVANTLAPEHLELCVEDALDRLPSVKNAGSIFLGRYCPEALGDYFAGPNHVLPTGGTARFSSPLSVDDFVKRSAFTYYTADALRAVSDDIAYFAETEELHAHARSATIRFEKD